MRRERDEDKYFAQLPRYSDEVAAAIVDKFRDELDRLKRSDRHRRMLRSYREYYGHGSYGDHTTSELGVGGVQGELTLIKVNLYASYVNTLHTMATLNPPNWESVAINSDWESLGAAQLSDGLLDYYYHTKMMERHIDQWVRAGLIFGESFLATVWNANTGEMQGVQDVVVDPDQGVRPLGEEDDEGDLEVHEKPVYNGDVEFVLHTPYTCVVDPAAKDRSQPPWMITLNFVNRYDLIAEHPQYAEEIRAMPGAVTHWHELGYRDEDRDDDTVGVYELWHASTPAVPAGRRVLVINPDVPPLIDGPLPYATMPVKRFTPEDILLGAGGTCVSFDLLSIVEAIHAQYSAILTNHTANAVQKYWTGPGGDGVSTVEYTHLSKGLAVIESSSKPEALNLTYTPPEVFEFLNLLKTTLSELTSQNDYTRGTANDTDLSGSAMAFLHSSAVQANNNLQKAVRTSQGELATHVIDVIRRFVSEPRVATIAGKHNRYALQEYLGSDLQAVNRVYVRAGSSFTDTAPGRLELAKMLHEAGYVDNGQQFITVLTTGRLEPMYERPLGQVMLIRKENEIMQGRGEGALRVAPTDRHSLHIPEHACVLDDPSIRDNPEVIAAVRQHIMEHIQVLMDPAMAPLLLQLGETPMSQPPGPGGPPQGPPGEQPQGGGEEIAGLGNEGNPQQPRMPKPPVNPATGERATLEGTPQAPPMARPS